MENLTMKLATFVSQLSYDGITREALGKVKACLLDSLGCAFFGSTTEWAKIVNEFVRNQEGVQEARLWTTDFMGPAANVVLGNGTMIHSFDFDDYHNAKIHPGAVVVPAVIATGERLGAGGKSILTAMTAGYETMIRVSLATGPSSSRLKGWHLTGTTGTFASAAAAGNLLKMTQDEMASALGMAGTQSAGLWAFTADGAMSKRFHAGRSSQSGVMAALLAQGGYKGPTQILEAEDGGFCKATSDNVNLSLATEALGERFFTGDVTVKPYACCGSIHSSIDAAQQLVRAHGINASEIEKVLVKTANVVKVQCGFEYEPLSVLQAQMSLQYCIAVVLLEGQVLVDQFTGEKISDPRVLELAKRVEIVLDPEIEEAYPEKFAGKVEIVLTNGKALETRVDHPTGSPENPMSFDDVAKKFESLAGTVMGRGRIEQIIQRVEGLEKLANIRELTELFA
jgi:2-methylcitrate dehydratase PrpD